MSNKVAIIGLGWLGLPLAKTLSSKGYSVIGSTTRSEKLMDLLQSNFAVRIIRANHNTIRGDWRKFIADASVLIIAIPPGRSVSKREEYPKKIRQIAKGCPSETKVIFISSSSVYGDHDKKMTEKETPNPTSEAGNTILEAETIISEHFGTRATILRMGGLFGPDRHPGHFLRKSALIKRPKGAINMIHQEDCIELISRVIQQDCFGEIINGCADHHPNRKEFYQRAAFDLSLELPEPDTEDLTLGKIIDNEKSISLLGMVYKYADPIDYFKKSF